jgi:hypothetical protein
MAEQGGPPYISAAAVAKLVGCADVVEVVREALVQFSEGEKGGVVQPVRTCIPVANHDG